MGPNCLWYPTSTPRPASLQTDTCVLPIRVPPFWVATLSFPLSSIPPQHDTLSQGQRSDHKGIAEGTALPVEAMPKFFAKSGFADVDPKKIKKDGGGRGNWGSYGDDIANENFTFVNPRRRSNSFSMSHHVNDFKTKFEVHEPEPVFE